MQGPALKCVWRCHQKLLCETTGSSSAEEVGVSSSAEEVGVSSSASLCLQTETEEKHFGKLTSLLPEMSKLLCLIDLLSVFTIRARSFARALAVSVFPGAAHENER